MNDTLFWIDSVWCKRHDVMSDVIPKSLKSLNLLPLSKVGPNMSLRSPHILLCIISKVTIWWSDVMKTQRGREREQFPFRKNISRKIALQLQLEHGNAMSFMLWCFYLLRKDNYRKVFWSRVIFFQCCCFNFTWIVLFCATWHRKVD